MGDISIFKAGHGLYGTWLAGGGFALAAHDTPGDGSQQLGNGGRQWSSKRSRAAGSTSGLHSARNGTNYAESGGKTQAGRLALAVVGSQENCRRAMKEVKLALSGGCFELRRLGVSDED
ncbi:hypothetical protein [Accumulibacter sp.]|uniref:hypothetical protein n=1 Tax=Accumulibacter sp. TaxID=2053492 RepID=UPI0025F993B5|nr:hypothetical protein [Accumulibacter sp.]MCM8610751.1 hypothetical protein [Accumulibacter sp.]MCM8634575.1 hypothetical protein [Accumulibacter sp.]MCM8638139.1 hypothetical protein [Accumulibacter sp.]